MESFQIKKIVILLRFVYIKIRQSSFLIISITIFFWKECIIVFFRFGLFRGMNDKMKHKFAICLRAIFVNLV